GEAAGDGAGQRRGRRGEGVATGGIPGQVGEGGQAVAVGGGRLGRSGRQRAGRRDGHGASGVGHGVAVGVLHLEGGARSHHVAGLGGGRTLDGAQLLGRAGRDGD